MKPKHGQPTSISALSKEQKVTSTRQTFVLLCFPYFQVGRSLKKQVSERDYSNLFVFKVKAAQAVKRKLKILKLLHFEKLVQGKTFLLLQRSQLS